MGKVVSLKDFKQRKEIDHSADECNEEKSESFEELAKKNKQKEEKLKAERIAANKSVLKSYKLKP